jgi:hypothetical protein
MNISSILANIDKSVLSEEAASSIASAFETAVNEKVDARVSLEIEKALNEQDEDHALKLKNLIEAIDKDHSEKLEQVVEAINSNHTVKLENVVKHYRSVINEKAEKFSNKIVEEMSNYLDLYLEKVIPQEQLTEAVANKYAANQLEQIRNIVGFDPSFVNNEMKQVVVNSKKAIESLQEQLNKSYKENIELNESVRNFKSSLVLEQKTKGLSPSKKNFIVKILSDKTPEYIEENFTYVADMFESDLRSTKQSLVSEASTEAITKGAKVPKTINEQTTTTNNGQVNSYLSALSEIDRRK